MRYEPMDPKEWAFTNRDVNKIEKLNKLTNVDTFWSDVRMLTRQTTSDAMIKRWQLLADERFRELNQEQN